MNIKDLFMVYNPFRLAAIHYLDRQIKNLENAMNSGTVVNKGNALSATETYEQMYLAYLIVKNVDVTRDGVIARQGKTVFENRTVSIQDGVSYYMDRISKETTSQNSFLHDL